MKDGWKPILHGEKYCSPLCGGGCTKAAYDQAVLDADALVARLKGTGWKPVIHENLGWHYRAVSGPVQVYPTNLPGKFWCMIGSEPKDSMGGSGLWTPQNTPSFKDPNRAVRNALSHVYPVIENLNLTLKAAEKAAGISKDS